MHLYPPKFLTKDHKKMFKQLNISIIRNVFNLAKNCRAQRFSSTTSTPEGTEANDTQFKHPSRPAWLEGQKLTDVVESKEEFEKYVKKILPDFTIPEPPAHKSYPTPSGWVPPDYKKASQLPYFVLRSRFHQFPIYPEERDGSKRYVRIRNIEGNIWVRK